MKKIFSLFAALIVTTCLWAANFKCGELYYNVLSGSTVSVTYEQYASSYNYDEIDGDLIIPSTVTYSDKTYTVVSIGNDAFTNCPMRSVTIPSSVTKIGAGAFNMCTMLTNVTIPNSVTSIGQRAFRYCYNLRSISISDNVTSIGEETFMYCDRLNTVTFGESITNIHETAFNQVALKTVIWNAENYSKAYTLPYSVNTVTFGNSVKHIPASLCRSTSISSISIPNSVTSIGENAFERCSALTSVTIGNSVTSIGSSAFYSCSRLTSVTIGNSVTSIGEKAFFDCDGLTSITFPNSVTSIGQQTFHGCDGLISVTIPNSVTNIGTSAFNSCKSLTTITIPNSIKRIDNATFYDCTSLKSLDIGNGVKSIGYNAFRYCSSLNSISIPNSVTSIENYAFSGCSQLTDITCNGVTPPVIQSTTFDDMAYSGTIYVPCGAIDAYQSADGWGKFKYIQEPLANYSIALIVNNERMGAAHVDSNSECGAQISATANYGYQFIQWSDGNTDNPRTLELTQDTLLTAEFAAHQYSITTHSSDSERGITQGDTTVNYLEYVTISAIANYGYHFSHWNDGNSDNPRVVKVTKDQTYMADFYKNTYHIITNCDDQMGSVSAPQSAEYLDEITISATANYGYHFIQWSDGNTDNPRTLELTQDTLLTAEFAAHQYSITTHSSDSERGITQGDTTVNYLEYVTISAIANYGYHFSHWEKESAKSNAKKMATSNTITVKAKVPSHWTDRITVWVWDDKNTGTEYVPTFENGWYVYTYTGSLFNIIFKNGYDWTGDHNQSIDITNITEDMCIELHQTGTGKATYIVVTDDGGNGNSNDNISKDITIKAKVPSHWTDRITVWVWDDKNTGTEYVPTFENGWYVYTYTGSLFNIIFKNGYDWTGDHNQSIDITNITEDMCIELHQDGSSKATYTIITDNEENGDDEDNEDGEEDKGPTWDKYKATQQIQVTENAIYIAYFEKNTYEVVINRNENGVITGEGIYSHGEIVTLTATANYGYRFVRWSNGVENNPYTFTISDNVTLSVEFEEDVNTAVDNTHSQSAMTNCQKIFRNGQLIILRDGVEYNAVGVRL